jgi:hypothetical protein
VSALAVVLHGHTMENSKYVSGYTALNSQRVFNIKFHVLPLARVFEYFLHYRSILNHEHFLCDP